MFFRKEDKNALTDGAPKQAGGEPAAGSTGKRKAYVTGSCHYDPSRPGPVLIKPKATAGPASTTGVSSDPAAGSAHNAESVLTKYAVCLSKRKKIKGAEVRLLLDAAALLRSRNA